MTWPGVIHVLLMAAGLVIGAAVLIAAKGTPWHRALGRRVVAAVLVSDILLVFAIYEDNATIGLVHVPAVVSFVSVLAAVVLARTRRGGQGARIAHAHIMLWSFGGLVTAGLGQGAILPGKPPLAGHPRHAPGRRDSRGPARFRGHAHRPLTREEALAGLLW